MGGQHVQYDFFCVKKKVAYNLDLKQQKSGCQECIDFQCWWKVPADLHDSKPAVLLVGVVPLVSIMQPDCKYCENTQQR